MSDPVDLTNLRSITEGDTELEAVLFEEFVVSGRECVEGLQQDCGEGECENWRTSAHALKGTSVNLGAMHLSDLCLKAQEEFCASKSDKQKMLDDIESEFDTVCKFLDSLQA